MSISTEERGIIQDVLDLNRRKTTQMFPQMMENPVAKYNDPKQLEQEINILFRNFPIIIAHASDLAQPGDFLTHDTQVFLFWSAAPKLEQSKLS